MKNTWIDAIRYLYYDFFLKYRLLANRFLIYHRIVRPFYLKLDRDVNYILGVGSEFGNGNIILSKLLNFVFLWKYTKLFLFVEKSTKCSIRWKDKNNKWREHVVKIVRFALNKRKKIFIIAILDKPPVTRHTKQQRYKL